VSRRATRELALRALFAADHAGTGAAEALAGAAQELRGRPDHEYAFELVNGTLSNLRAVDRAILAQLRGWTMQQMPAVDRVLLRLATFELLFTANPPGAVVDEAVSLAKAYSTADSGGFINAVLRGIGRAAIQSPEQLPERNLGPPECGAD
jgi:N utilization substance protein B